MARIYECVRANGRKYTVQDYQGHKVLRLDDAQAVQSFGTAGETGLYYDDIAAAVPLGALDILILGLGGGTVARRLRELGQTSAFIVGVDDDLTMLELGRKHFGLQKYVDVIVHQSAQDFMADPPFAFDVVIIDCFRDTWKKIHLPMARNLLREGGMLIDYDINDGISIEHF